MNNDDNENVNESDSLPINNSALFDYVCTIYTYPMTPDSADVTEPLTFYNMDDGSHNIVLDMGMAMTPPTSVSTNEENINPTTTQNPDEVPHENPFQVTSVSESPNPDYSQDHAEFEVDSFSVSVSASDFDENEMLVDIADSDDDEIMVIDLSDSDFDDDINTDSPGLEIEPERRNNENKFSVDMKRVIQEIEEAKKKLHDELAVLASKLANIQSENKVCHEELDDLEKNFELQMMNLWDEHLMDCTLSELYQFFDRNSFNLEFQALKEELNNQEARLNAIVESRRAIRNLEATNSDGTGTSTENAARNSMSVSFSGFNIAQFAHSGHLIPINNVGQIVENVIPYPQPQQSQMPLPIFFRVFGNISNHQEAWRPIPIPMQIQQPVSTTLSSSAFIYGSESLSLPWTSGSKISPEGKEGGKARRKSAGNKENRVTCSNCFKVLDKYYLNKVNGHKKYCKPIGPPPTV